MKNTFKKLIPLVMIISILFSSLGISTLAAQSNVEKAKEIAGNIENWLFENISVDEGNTDINGAVDWAVFADARFSSTNTESYLSYINAAVRENYDTLYLSDLARIALAVDANGGDARSVGGHDLIAAIAGTDYSAETYTAGISYSLLVLNSKDYGEQAAAEKLVQTLIAAQRADNGFNYMLKLNPNDTNSTDGDVDTTAMVLQALAPYADDADVAAVITPALAFIKAAQKDSGGFGGSWGESADSTSQVIVALSTLGIDPLGDEFIKGGKSVLDAIKTYQNDDGGIKGWDGKSNIMSSYQMLYALTSYVRFAEGSCGLFDFSDVVPVIEETTQTQTTETFTEVVTGDTTEGVTETVINTDIPQTGSGKATAAVVLLISCAAFTAVVKIRKNDE